MTRLVIWPEPALCGPELGDPVVERESEGDCRAKRELGPPLLPSPRSWLEKGVEVRRGLPEDVTLRDLVWAVCAAAWPRGEKREEVDEFEE